VSLYAANGRLYHSPVSGYVFISYSRRDRPYVELLDTHLAGAGVAVWFDERIEYGQAWTAEISDKLDNCAAVLVVAPVSSSGGMGAAV
jgi:hypothetical protein